MQLLVTCMYEIDTQVINNKHALARKVLLKLVSQILYQKEQKQFKSPY